MPGTDIIDDVLINLYSRHYSCSDRDSPSESDREGSRLRHPMVYYRHLMLIGVK